MTRLSDLLRGAADQAPIGDVSVSTAHALRRVRVHRGVRGAANGLVGAGAAALIVVGAIHPSTGAGSHDTALDTLANPVPAEQADGQTSDLGGGRESMPRYDSGWGTCGSYPLDSYPSGPGAAITLSIDSDGWSGLEGGTTLDVPVTLLATDTANVSTTGPDVAILYQGMLVGLLSNASAEQILNVTVGDSGDSALQVPLVNCFDGSALPAATYEIVVSQAFADIADEPSTEPSTEPSATPSTQPTPEPTATSAPQPEPSVGIGTGTAEPGSVGDSSAGSTPSVIAPMPIEPATWEYRVTSDPVTMTIAGDVVDDPFGGYLDTWVPPVLPSDILTPAAARELYSQNIALDRWTMAPGTSRWIIPNYSAPTPTDVRTLVAPPADSWYGCSYDGVTGLTFPTESATLDLLDVSVNMPSRINLSYGWVVDGNPRISYTVTNTSGYSLPGFYGEPNHQLYLVQNGRVVAEAYPVNANPNNPVLYRDSTMDGTTTDETSPDAAEYWGILEPGKSVSGDYLWRDVNGCWNDSGQALVRGGTYTVLSVQSLYLQSETPMPMDTDTMMIPREDTAVSSGASNIGEPEPLIDPYYYPTYDWLELQMWTSLGTVTITTS
jgi:hypothetical protein